VERDYRDDEIVLRLRGTVDEVALFSHKLRLERTLEFTVGVPEVRIYDTVRNFGGSASPLMMLYHCNFGYPIVSPHSVLTSPSTRVEPRDTEAEKGFAVWSSFGEPDAAFKEQVYWHYLDANQPSATASIINRQLGVGIELECDPSTLPYMTEWKQTGFGDYTCGIEPGNCLPTGRVKARESGVLKMLEAGDSERFSLAIRVTHTAS
jgi:hypothetical protein